MPSTGGHAHMQTESTEEKVQRIWAEARDLETSLIGAENRTAAAEHGIGNDELGAAFKVDYELARSYAYLDARAIPAAMDNSWNTGMSCVRLYRDADEQASQCFPE